MRRRLESAFDYFIDASKKSNEEVALLSRNLQIDIAIDLGGYTKDSRIGAFSYRLAPIQISYLGYLGTLGTSYMDYIIADKTIIPEDSTIHYSEKIIYLPNYQINDTEKNFSRKLLTKAEFGISNNTFVFCCLNNNYKISPHIFEGWVRILKGCHNSVLLLLADNILAKENIKKEAAKYGLDHQRIIFSERMGRQDYLARYQITDLFLDTRPYNAGTTASDALWCGIPILTLAGESFSSRMAASLLNSIGLSELITTTQDQYEEKAIYLGLNPSALRAIQLKLHQNRATQPLFNSALTTKKIEQALTEAYHLHHENLPPANIYVSE